MINIKNKKDCCGCGACAQACPKQCIALFEDRQGFLYPHVNKDLCVDCGLCTKVCPILNVKPYELPKDTTTLAAFNRNDSQRASSSSGGMFQLMAEEVLANQGIVYGAKFNKQWNVVHGWIDSIDGLEELKRSKYVQSEIGNSYSDTQKFLKEDKTVLFVGTPCQIAGLKHFLHKDYDKLTCVDVVCHGVPSVKIWQKYLNEQKQKIKDQYSLQSTDNVYITNISFRDKRVEGWNQYHLYLSLSFIKNDKKITCEISDNIWDNDYMLSFLKDYALRPSCFHCKFRNGKSRSDITLADYWGIKNWCNDIDFIGEKGTSLLYIHNEKASQFIRKIDFAFKEMNFTESWRANPAVMRNWKMPASHGLFFLLTERKTIKEAYDLAVRLNIIPAYLCKQKGRLIMKLKRLWQK